MIALTMVLPEWLVIHTFYGGLNEENRLELDSVSNGSFLSYNHDEAWNLIMSIQENIESHEDMESMVSSNSSEYVCVNDFLANEKTHELINTLGIDSFLVRKIVENYVGHLQVPR